MKSIRNLLTGSVLASGGLLTAAIPGLSPVQAAYAQAVDEPATTTVAPGPLHGPHGMHGSHDFGGPEGWGGAEHFLRELGLTTEQQASIGSILTAARPQLKALHDTMRANRLKLMQTKPDDPNYASVVAEVAQSNAALASRRTTQGADMWAQMYAVLTVAQKTQLATLETQWAANPQGGH